jgi:Ni/Fe-hydrogenase subunit HybB-like protein
MVAAGLAFLLRDQEAISLDASVEPFNTAAVQFILVIFAVFNGILGISVWAKQHPIATASTAGAAVLAGTWLERWNIVVPTTTHPRLIYYSSYTPTSTELILTVASVALFVLALMVFFKLFPAIPIWEVKEGELIDKAQKQITIPVPEPSEAPRRRWGFR